MQKLESIQETLKKQHEQGIRIETWVAGQDKLSLFYVAGMDIAPTLLGTTIMRLLAEENKINIVTDEKDAMLKIKLILGAKN